MKYLNWFLNLVAIAIIIGAIVMSGFGLWYLSILVGVTPFEVIGLVTIVVFCYWRISEMANLKKYKRFE